MRRIPLQAVPNQQISFEQDGNRWVVDIKTAVSSLVANVTINDIAVISGVRIPGDSFILPYRYMGVSQGNLMLATQQDLLPNWELLGVTQELYYWSPDDMESLRNG